MRPHYALFKILIAGCIFLLPAIVRAGTTGEISGSVSDLVTHAPIAGAGITVVSPTSRYKAVSDSTGFYAIINVFPDTYVVTASATGYDSRTINGNTVNQDQTLTVSFELVKIVKTLARIQVKGITNL